MSGPQKGKSPKFNFFKIIAESSTNPHVTNMKLLCETTMHSQTVNNVVSSTKYRSIIITYISCTLDVITVKKAQKAAWRRISWNIMIDGREFLLSTARLTSENS